MSSSTESEQADNWLTKEVARAKQRSEQLPAFARPTVVRANAERNDAKVSEGEDSNSEQFDMEVSTNVWYEEKGIGEDGWYYSVFVVYRNGDETSGDEAPYAWGHADTRDEAVEHAFTATSALFNGE